MVCNHVERVAIMQWNLLTFFFEKNKLISYLCSLIRIYLYISVRYHPTNVRERPSLCMHAVNITFSAKKQYLLRRQLNNHNTICEVCFCTLGNEFMSHHDRNKCMIYSNALISRISFLIELYSHGKGNKNTTNIICRYNLYL